MPDIAARVGELKFASDQFSGHAPVEATRRAVLRIDPVSAITIQSKSPPPPQQKPAQDPQQNFVRFQSFQSISILSYPDLFGVSMDCPNKSGNDDSFICPLKATFPIASTLWRTMGADLLPVVPSRLV